MGSSTFESIAIAWFACFIDFLGMFVVVPVITPLALAYNANVSQVALLFSITLGTNVLSSFVFGKLRDMIQRTKPLLLLSFGGSCVFTTIQPLMPNFASLVVARAVAGLFTGTLVLAQSYIARNAPPADRQRYMAICTSMIPVAIIFGPMIGGGLYALDGLKLPFYVAGGLGGLGFILALVAFTDDQPPPLPSPMKKSDDLATRNRSQSEVVMSEHKLVIILTMLCGFLHYFSALVFQSIGLYYMDRKFGTGPLAYGFVQTTGGLIAAICQTFGFIKLSQRIGKHGCEILGALICGLGYIVMATSGNLEVFLVGVLLEFSGYGLGIPAITTLLARYAPPSRQGVILGLGQASMGLGRFFGGLISGPLYTIGPNQPYYAAAGVAFTSAVVMACALALNHRLPEHMKESLKKVVHDKTFPSYQQAVSEVSAITSAGSPLGQWTEYLVAHVSPDLTEPSHLDDAKTVVYNALRHEYELIRDEYGEHIEALHSHAALGAFNTTIEAGARARESSMSTKATKEQGLELVVEDKVQSGTASSSAV